MSTFFVGSEAGAEACFVCFVDDEVAAVFIIAFVCIFDANASLGEGRGAGAPGGPDGSCVGLRRMEWGMNELVFSPLIVAGAE